ARSRSRSLMSCLVPALVALASGGVTAPHDVVASAADALLHRRSEQIRSKQRCAGERAEKFAPVCCVYWNATAELVSIDRVAKVTRTLKEGTGIPRRPMPFSTPSEQYAPN